jgi:hypothetical protein
MSWRHFRDAAEVTSQAPFKDRGSEITPIIIGIISVGILFQWSNAYPETPIQEVFLRFICPAKLKSRRLTIIQVPTLIFLFSLASVKIEKVRNP